MLGIVIGVAMVIYPAKSSWARFLPRRARSCQEAVISWVRSWPELGWHNLGALGKILDRNLVQELFAGIMLL